MIGNLSNVENLTGTMHVDDLYGDGGANVLTGGGAADRFTGGGGVDRFDYNAINEGLDTITDFVTGRGGDQLDIKDVLIGYDSGRQNDFIQLSGADSTTVSVNADGSGADFVALATLLAVANSGSLLNDMISNGNLLVL